MWIQVIGSVLIIVATTMVGISFQIKENYRKQELERLERALLLMKNQITYFASPMAEIFQQIGWKTEGVIGFAFHNIGKDMETRQGCSAEDIWKKGWDSIIKESYFTAHDFEEILSFGKTLDFLDRQQQEGSVDMLLGYIRKRQEEIEKRLHKNGKLYYSMGVLSGLLLVVTLL